MAKVIITVEDVVDENGEATVDISMVFDPPIEKDQPTTLAQNAAGHFLDMLSQTEEMKVEVANGEF